MSAPSAALSSAHQAGPLGIETPIGNQVTHGSCIVAGSAAYSLVQLMGLNHLLHINLHPQARTLGHPNRALLDAQWITRQALAVLPDPVGVHRGDRPGGRRGDMS